MTEGEPDTGELLAGEGEWLAAVVGDLADDRPKLAYADWLEERGDDRGQFLRAFVRAARSMDPADFPPAGGLPEEWLELVGYRLLERAAAAGLSGLRDRLLRLARPALRMDPVEVDGEDERIPVGASKVGGLPDLPPGTAWPAGRDCHAVLAFDGEVGEGDDEPAVFLGQISFAEIKDTQAARGLRLPEAGLLSFFCGPRSADGGAGWSGIGVTAVFVPDPAGLVRAGRPPGWDTDGEFPYRLTFREMLDLPCSPYDPWRSELQPDPGEDYRAVLDRFGDLSYRHLFGYERELNAERRNDAVEPSRRSRHLITLEYESAAGVELQIQIDEDDLAARNFDRITLLSVNTGG